MKEDLTEIERLRKLSDLEFSEKVSVILKDDDALAEEIMTGQSRVHSLRRRIVASSKANFILERDLKELDDKIKLLIKNLITVQEVISTSSGLSRKKKESIGNPLRKTREKYEGLFYILQNEPKYFARLARVISGSQVHSFVQTVVFDMYGDQYDTREERLLLSLFQMILKHEFEANSELGTLLRANTAVTQIMSAYAKRGLGLSILKNTLQEPILKLCKEKGLMLELMPLKIEEYVITTYETESGEKWPHVRSQTAEEALSNSDVRDELERRKIRLVEYAELFLSRIVSCAEEIPFGIRWICKQLKSLAMQHFPHATKYQLGSLVGGYICLRFFSPVIVTPDALNFVDFKLDKAMRRNLVLIAKMIQNLSNGVHFGDKEQYMVPVNHFIDEQKDNLLRFFNRLADVENLSYDLVVDTYLAHTNARNAVINTTLNQIFHIHFLLIEYRDVAIVDRTDERLASILESLPNPPEKLDSDDNTHVMLDLVEHSVSSPKNNTRLTHHASDILSSDNELFSSPLFEKSKNYVHSLIKSLPIGILHQCNDMFDIIKEAQVYASETKDAALGQILSKLEDCLRRLRRMTTDTRNPIEGKFINSLLNKARTRLAAAAEISRRYELISNALRTIEEHHLYLQGQLEFYEEYLECCRKGIPHSENEKSAKKVKKKNKLDSFKMAHSSLEESGVISWVDAEMRKTLKKCVYKFSWFGEGQFKVEPQFKKIVKFKANPINMRLEDLLKLQEAGETELDMEYLKLNVNLLVHLLNKRFVA